MRGVEARKRASVLCALAVAFTGAALVACSSDQGGDDVNPDGGASGSGGSGGRVSESGGHGQGGSGGQSGNPGDGGTAGCVAPNKVGYRSPGCGGAAPAVCVSGVAGKCFGGYACSCDGVDTAMNCIGDVQVPFRHRGSCASLDGGPDGETTQLDATPDGKPNSTDAQADTGDAKSD